MLYDNETGKTGDFGLFDNIVDQISAIADVKASLITNDSQRELECSVVPSDLSDFCSALIGECMRLCMSVMGGLILAMVHVS